MIRRATAGDVAMLCALGRRTFVETFVEDFAIPYPAADRTRFEERVFGEAAVAAKVADPVMAVWLAERDGVEVGYAAAGPCGLPHPDVAPGDVELKQIYITREAQGSGVGRALLATVLDWMAGSARPMWIGVWSGNRRAQAIYAARGFVAVGTYQFPVGDWLDDELILRRG